MTPSVPKKNNLSFLDWAPGQNDPATNVESDDCNGRCHPTPKKGLPAFSRNQPWLLDTLKADSKGNDALKAWLAQKQFPPIAKPVETKPTPTPTVKPGAPQDATALNDQAKELERQARLSMDPEQKTRFYQSALAFRLISGDDSGAGATLKELEGLYKKSGNDVGLKLVAANRLWVEGKPDEALKSFADMEKDAQGAGWAFNQQYAAQRSILLQSVAAEKLKAEDYAGAKDLLMKALVLTPSDQLTARILKLMADHGEAGLAKQSEDLAALQARRDALAMPPNVCNSCHSSTSDKDKIDLSDFSSFNGGPDLSAYKNLRHLSYQQKLELHKLDGQISDAKTRLVESTAAVKELLFLQSLDDPKIEIADLEKKFLDSTTAFSGPDRALPWHLAGEAFLAKKEWAKAAAALQVAVKEDPSLVDAQFSLGHALYATGDFKASRDAYGEILKHQPQDVLALRYRAEANSKYLTALDPKVHGEEIAKVEAEIASDRALLLSRMAHAEKDKLGELEKKLELLREGGDASLESRQGTLDMMELMAKQYLALADTKQANVPNAELVRKEMNGLASQTFGLMAKFAKADSDPEIKKRAGLYEGYSLLAQGKIDEAAKTFEPYRKEVPEIEKILGTLEKNRLRMVNLAALDAWAAYNKEGSAIQADNQNGLLGKGIGLVEGAFRGDGKDFRDDTRERWKGQVAFVAEMRTLIDSGKADTILDAMKVIEANGPESMKADARYHINYEDRLYTGYPLGALVHAVDKMPPDKEEIETLLRKTWDLERQNSGAVESPYALYTLVNHLDPEVSFNGTARSHMDALEGHGSFGRSAFKFITSMSPETLAVDVLLMVASAGLGNLAKLAALSKLEKAGITGYKAIVLAGAAGIGVEATALWAANLGKEAMGKDPSKVFTQDHMLRSYGSTLIMIGGLKGFGKLGETVAPRAAKSLGLVTEGGSKLSAGGKVLSWSIGHGMGLSGMIATSHTSQALGLTPKPIGGWKEGLVHDVFGYVQFAVAHKIADRAFGGKLSAIGQKQHTEIAVKEAIALAKSQADAFGFPATRGAKGEIVDSPARQILVGMLVEASLSKPGFSGGKLAKLVESRKFAEANAYFAEFGMPLEYGKSGELVAVARGEASPHEAAGVPAGKAKPVPPPFNLEKKFGEFLDKAMEWLFPGGGDGGFGGMQPAMAGAYNMAARKAEPKGPPVAMMSGRNRGEKNKKTNPATPVEPTGKPGESANDNQHVEVIEHVLKPGDNIDAALNTLSVHFNDPAKLVIIKCQRPLENPETIQKKLEAYDSHSGIRIEQPDSRPSFEVPAKTRMDQIHTDALSDGQTLMWDAHGKTFRDFFEVKGNKGEIFLTKPDGVTRIEISAEKPLSADDIAYLTLRARHLGVEIEVEAPGKAKMSFEAPTEGLKIKSDKPIDADSLNSLIALASKAGENIEITTPEGKLEIKKGLSEGDTKVFTKDPKAALVAPEKIILQLDKAPTGAELKALKDQGIKNVRFQDDPSAPGWFAGTLEAMKEAKGLNVRAVNDKGKMIWENVAKSTGDSINTPQKEIFLQGLELHAKAAGWKDRLAETQKLLGPESRFEFAPEALRWAASHDISDASVPKGKSKPTITPEQVDAWIKRGTELATIKHSKAQEKGKSRLAAELAPFAEGLSVDPTKTGGWGSTVAALKAYLAKDPTNPGWAGELFGILNRDPYLAPAFENNAYDLAKHLATATNPHRGIEDLVVFARNSKGLLKIQGSFFGSFLKSGDTGAKAEVGTLHDMVAQAGVLTAQGRQVVIDAIPTSKLLEGTTPDFSVTVTGEGGLKSMYTVEVKRAGEETVKKSGVNIKDFTGELEAGYSGKKSDESTLGSLIGKGLYQLGTYKGKETADYLVLNVRLEGDPPVYFEKAVKEFLTANCPGVAVKLTTKSGTEVVLRADGAGAKYSPYDANSNFFAPSLAAAGGK